MTFDAPRYRKSVLAEFQKSGQRRGELQEAAQELAAGRTVPSTLDLFQLYGITDTMNPADTAEQVAGVADVFNKEAGKPTYKQVAQLARQVHQALAMHHPDLATPAFWHRYSGVRKEQTEELLETFGEALAHDLLLKVITPERLRSVATAHGLPLTVGQDQLTAAVRRHDIEVHPDFDVAEVKPFPPTMKALGGHAAMRGPVDAIFWGGPQLQGITVVDAFTVPGAGIVRPEHLLISPARSGKGHSEEMEAAKKFVNQLIDGHNDEAALHRLFLFYFYAEARERLQHGALHAMVVRHLVDREGLSPVDAARIVTKAGGPGKVFGSADVTARLATGELQEARRIVDALKDMPNVKKDELEHVRTAVENAEAKKKSLRGQAEAAIASGNYARAGQLLRDITSVCTDDKAITMLLERLPPPAPVGLTAREQSDGRSVELVWNSDPTGPSGVRHRVVRRKGPRPPINENDGEVLAGELSQTRFSDPTPPVAHQVHYAVFATTDGLNFSKGATVGLSVLPPPSRVSVSNEPTRVIVRWNPPRAATSVSVLQTAPDGSVTDLVPDSDSQATASGLITGGKYVYSLTACYVMPDGSPARSRPTQVEATPRGAVRVVDDLVLEQDDDDSTVATARAVWSAVPGYRVDLWRLPAHRTLQMGARIGTEDLIRLGGVPVEGTFWQVGSEQRLSFSVTEGIHLFVPVTMDREEGLIGACRRFGGCPPVAGASIERFGDEAVISWTWPRGDYEVDVCWTNATGEGRKRVSLASYRSTGGLRLPVGDGACDVELRTVTFSNGAEWNSMGTRLHLPGSMPAVRYVLSRRNRLLGSPRAATVTASVDDRREEVHAVLVAKPGRIMPRNAEDGKTVARLVFDFRATTEQTCDVALPRLTSPYWLRLFPAPGQRVRFQDPPTSSLQG